MEGILLALLVGATEASRRDDAYSLYKLILSYIDDMLYRIKVVSNDNTTIDVYSVYYTLSLLVLGSKDDTKRQLLYDLSYPSAKFIEYGNAFFNEVIPTYSQFSLESYIDLSKEAELDSEFDRIVTEYMPLVVKRKSDKLCKNCTAKDWVEDPLTETQQVCFASFSDYKADWAKQFDPTQTSKTTFNNIDESVKNINIMSRTGLALYKEDKDTFKSQILAIPFANLDSFLILMKPYDATDIDTLVEKVESESYELVTNTLYKLAPTNVKIRLPKFKVMSDIDFPSAYADDRKKISNSNAETAILKKYPNTHIKYYRTNIAFELNEEGINYNAETVAGNVECDGLPERKIPTLKKSSVKSPVAVPKIVDLVAGTANETLKAASDTVIEFNGTSPFVFIVFTTDLAKLAVGSYYGY